MEENKIPYYKVKMKRDTLGAIPQIGLPSGYSIRTYEEGDQSIWCDIWNRADNCSGYDDDRFHNEFVSNIGELSERCYFIEDSFGKPIGTGTVWSENHDDRDNYWARLFWIAILPEHQGKGLFRPFVSHLLEQSKILGYERAMLYTETFRIPAIKVYLDYDFVPCLDYVKGLEAWQVIKENLSHEILDEYLKE